MRQRVNVLPVTLALSVFVSAAAAQSCEKLKLTDRMSLPDGQAAAAVTGRLKPVGVPNQHLAIPQGPLGSVRISLDRTQCYGTCPDYTVELNGDGLASFTGRNFVLLHGKVTFKVPEQSVRCLLSHFQEADFWSLNDEYVADITDGPRYRLDLTISGETKSVTDYFGRAVGMPGIVSAIEDEIDRVADVDRWVKGTANTLPSLRDEHFDFHSKVAATLLANAVAGASPEFINELIDAGAPVTGRVDQPGMIKGSTAIERASGAGRIAIVQTLIAKGALADGLQDTKDGALRAAAASGVPEIVAEILKYDPNANARDFFGNTALLSVQRGTRSAKGNANDAVFSIVRMLLAVGADPNATNGSGETALFYSNSADAVRLLVKSGAKVNVRATFGWTPLLTARSDDAAVALIEAGADTAAISRSGETVVKEFEVRKYKEAMRLLRERRR